MPKCSDGATLRCPAEGAVAAAAAAVAAAAAAVDPCDEEEAEDEAPPAAEGAVGGPGAGTGFFGTHQLWDTQDPDHETEASLAPPDRHGYNVESDAKTYWVGYRLLPRLLTKKAQTVMAVTLRKTSRM